MASDNEPGETCGFYQRDPVRHRYLAREILKCVPLEALSRHSLPIKADMFYHRDGTLIAGGVAFRPLQEVMRPSTVALLLPPGFDRQYGEALDGPDIASMAAGAMHYYLGLPFEQFVAGHAFGDSELKMHLIIIDRDAYVNMAKAALMQLADSFKGADLIGLSNADTYRKALQDPQSMASQVVSNLLRHLTLNKQDMDNLRRHATLSENFEFITMLNAQREQGRSIS